MPKKPKTYHGRDAVQQFSRMEGRHLSMGERRVVEEEGFVDGVYLDDVGIETSGVGQTGKYRNMSFDETYKAHEDVARQTIHGYDGYPEYVRAELTQLAYRGDVARKWKWVQLLNAGRVAEAAAELLDHAEYKERKRAGDDGVTRRLEAAQSALFEYAADQSR